MCENNNTVIYNIHQREISCFFYGGKIMIDILYEIPGVGSIKRIEVYENKVVLCRSRKNGDKTIMTKSIQSIELRLATTFKNGILKFNIIGDKGTIVFGTTMDYENEIIFQKDNNELAEQIKQFLEEKIASAAVQIESGADAPIFSPAGEILKYKNLLDIGAITQEEYDAKKKQLLNL